MSEAVHVLRSPEEAQVALQPVRLRILELTQTPASATGIAPTLDLPRQVVNYHLRELERVGLVELVEERARRGRTERLYRSVAGAFVVAPRVMGEVSVEPSAVKDRASSDYLVALGARLVDDISDLRADGRAVPTLAVETEIAFESDADRAEFARDLAAAMRVLAGRYHRPSDDSQSYRLVVAAHPAPPREMP